MEYTSTETPFITLFNIFYENIISKKPTEPSQSSRLHNIFTKKKNYYSANAWSRASSTKGILLFFTVMTT